MQIRFFNVPYLLLEKYTNMPTQEEPVARMTWGPIGKVRTRVYVRGAKKIKVWRTNPAYLANVLYAWEKDWI